jgi:hypothetical protein
MKIKMMQFRLCMFILGAIAFSQSITPQNTFGRKNVSGSSFAALLAFVPPAQLPPPRVLQPEVKMQLPPVVLPKHETVQKITINPPPITAPRSEDDPGVKTAQAVYCQDDPRVCQSNTDYTVWRNDFTHRTYESQMIQSWIIFVLVLVLVVAGLFFAWLQFQHSLHLKQVIKCSAAAAANTNADPTPQPDEFAFGKDGVVIRSAYLGVIILVISMAFFFLYLKYVYSIT